MNSSQHVAYGTALLRISLGVLALAHGLLKLLVFTPAGTVGFFASLGFPAIFAWATMGVEIIAGLALIVGIRTRIASLALIPVLLGATSVHLQFGWVFSNEGGGWEFPAFWAMALLVQSLLGSGAFALKAKRAGKDASAPALA